MREYSFCNKKYCLSNVFLLRIMYASQKNSILIQLLIEPSKDKHRNSSKALLTMNLLYFN